ncbi:carbohydrate kinase [Labrys miyagiensis]
MPSSVIACDLGTGGVKSAIYDLQGRCIADCVSDIKTHYPQPSRHEQRPVDWWVAVVDSIRRLLREPGVQAEGVGAIALSGHSLGCIPLSTHGELLQDLVPIWSDGRAEAEAERFFQAYDRRQWYFTTGNGFPAPLYTLFKILWLRNHAPEIFNATTTIIGTKDYINFRLTGRIATDHSYASGSGFYDLTAGRYAPELLAAADLAPSLFPEILPSTAILGTILPDIAGELGLPSDVKIVAGGVDNSCMALGARTFREGDIFSSMGSSSWLTISSAEPLLDDAVMPYVFAHVVPGQFISATSIFSSGTSLAWVRDTLLPDLATSARQAGVDVHEALTALAATAPRGAHGLIFVPTLGGGTSFEGGTAVRGGFVGLDLTHGRADIVRATLEGIALGLRSALDELRRMTKVSGEMIMVGGGARSTLWRQIFADVFECSILKTGIDQQAASLGAAALALVGTGAWDGFAPLDALHETEALTLPREEAAPVYAKALEAYRKAAAQQRDSAPELSALRALSV